MSIIKDFKALLKPILDGTILFVLVSLVFIASCGFFEYQQYLSAYQRDQRKEVSIIREKTKAFLEKIQELAGLTSDRIIAMDGEPQQIREILISTSRLYDPGEIPKIQKISYYKLSDPPKLITRYEAAPLEPQAFPEIQDLSNKTSAIFYQDFFLSKSLVFNSKGKLEGVLEIHIALSEFKASLGVLKYLTFDPLISLAAEKTHFFQKEPFALYGKNPQVLWKFVSLNKARYGIFIVYFFLCVFCFLLGMTYFRRDLQKIYRAKIETQNTNIKVLNADLVKLQTTVEETRKNFQRSEEKRRSHDITCNSYKKIHSDLSFWQQEQTFHICKCLNILTQSYKGSSAELSPEHQLKLLRSCLQSANLLANGLISKMKNEPIVIKTLLEKTKSLFAEKIYTSKLNIEIVCENNLHFVGDRFFTQFILVNLLGRAVHRVPKNGTITLTSTSQDDGILFEVQDKGFVLVNSSEKLIKKSFAFLAGKDDFQKICIQNGLKYQYLRDEENFNRTAIFIPVTSERELKSNIVDLFSKEVDLT
ncbi:MAG: hypothetical protein KBD36_02710 [Alphaproteobacteria bacterium]|jgi:hypothetical protein|nr:hypothetical protein [Alphaproteobacteria bacterium]MBP9776739.1 hypothetical protein [Alphaproteobacteria bacterium]